MPRRPNIDPPTRLETKIPQTLRAKLDLYLWSELEGRVPHGKYQEFLCDRIREFFEWRRIPLTPYGFPEGYFIAGPKESIELLDKIIKAHRPEVIDSDA